MSKPTFAERCLLAEQCLPDAPYRAMLKKLHTEMMEALVEQPAQQEPVSFLDWYDNAHWGNEDFKAGCWRAWDAALAQRKPLTDEEIEEIAARTLFPVAFARAIEAAHGIKEQS